MNDNSCRHVELRQPNITDMYGLDFSPAHAVESMVVLASRLSGWPKSDVESIQYSSLIRVMNVVGDLAAQATQSLGVVK